MEKSAVSEKVKLRQQVMIDSVIYRVGEIMEKSTIPPKFRTREFLALPDEDLGKLDYRAPEPEEIDLEPIIEDGVY